MKFMLRALAVSLILFGCTAQEASDSQYREQPEETEVRSEMSAPEEARSGVIAVEATTNNANGYTFSVTIKSPDTGCDQYANWWEVITEDGNLLYRRILAHSHVEEQPFTRSGGPVEIEPDEVVIVRSRMYPTGYQSQAMQGSFSNGFETTTLPTDFAIELTETEPLPTDCNF
ncbi:MAG: hypothetical protein ACFB16_06225 [Phormidesmis sp.]